MYKYLVRPYLGVESERSEVVDGLVALGGTSGTSEELGNRGV